ncbi:hypothetical protein OG874_41415 [Nocardia sp. NBC_00565]|uniref:hypothetical protein n=1 Tax=Nocardia sp. NBC_00565 TaxID=2975993 RepID=UPI002E8081EE|nr:hypothetical protein [Nocardia sp. NBC_00565]WUC03070.1 hypothetical protein OG874_41415 [Nocardia sp. NBC_00565]
MWEWSRRTAEHASAASWTSWQPVRTEPTVVEPECRSTETTESTTAEESSGMAAPLEYYLVG